MGQDRKVEVIKTSHESSPDLFCNVKLSGDRAVEIIGLSKTEAENLFFKLREIFWKDQTEI